MTVTTEMIFTNSTSDKTSGSRLGETGSGQRADTEHQPLSWGKECTCLVGMMVLDSWMTFSFLTLFLNNGLILIFPVCWSPHHVTLTYYWLMEIQSTYSVGAQGIPVQTSISLRSTKISGLLSRASLSLLIRHRVPDFAMQAKSLRTDYTFLEGMMEYSVLTTFTTSSFQKRKIK